MEEWDLIVTIIVCYFVISVLLMFASEKTGHYAGVPFGRYSAKAARFAQVSIFTFGAPSQYLLGPLTWC
jgi:hypothetical protein